MGRKQAFIFNAEHGNRIHIEIDPGPIYLLLPIGIPGIMNACEQQQLRRSDHKKRQVLPQNEPSMLIQSALHLRITLEQHG